MKMYIHMFTHRSEELKKYFSFIKKDKNVHIFTNLDKGYYESVIICDKYENKTLYNLFGKLFLESSKLNIDEYHFNSKELLTNDDKYLNEIMLSFNLSMYQYDKDIKTKFIFDDKVKEERYRNATVVSKAINHARSLANTPANQLHPVEFKEFAEKLFKDSIVTLEVLNKEELIKLNAGGILAVNQGSAYEPYMLVLKYTIDETKPYTAFVGKGITFDSGGYSLKTREGMVSMKYDMCGGASVLAVMEIISQLGAKQNVVGIIPLTENMIDANAYKVDDVITMLNGLKVEITNTDAEGRLILADAISYADKYCHANKIIDIATLTGACANALGRVYTGVFTVDEVLYKEFVKATKEADEAIWRLPLVEEYTSPLRKTQYADLVNSVRVAGGASVAAGFLNEFKGKARYLHLDIAGTSDKTEASINNPSGATGVMIRSMYHLVK